MNEALKYAVVSQRFKYATPIMIPQGDRELS